MDFVIRVLKKILKKNIYKYSFTQKLLFKSQLIKKDYFHNKDIFRKLNLNFDKCLNNIIKFKPDFNIYETSFHYNLFLALSEKKDSLNILEIGTYKGEFTNFLSLIFPKSKIATIDLSEKVFNNLVGENISYNFNEIKKIRLKNINKNNITYYEMNSNNLLDKFKEILLILSG